MNCQVATNWVGGAFAACRADEAVPLLEGILELLEGILELLKVGPMTLAESMNECNLAWPHAPPYR